VHDKGLETALGPRHWGQVNFKKTKYSKYTKNDELLPRVSLNLFLGAFLFLNILNIFLFF